MDFVDDDFLLALELQEQLDKDSWQPSKPPSKPSTDLSIVDDSWEYIDPNPDIRELFLQFNQEFFWGRLAGIEVKWSPRMTLCAGLCVYEGRGGLCSVRLSLPLLKLRPRKDLVETLLHEMIHAYLFVTDNNKDHDGHGPEFHKHMYRINKATGTKISVYHTFHDEVDQYRQHWWRCNGPCQNRKPFFGYVKRAMNRAPSERDPWWNDHKRTCNGTYIKIKEPEGYGKKKSKEKSDKTGQEKNHKKEKLATDGKKGNPDIRSFLGKGQVLHSGQPQQKVIVNGVLTLGKTEKKSEPNFDKPCTSTSSNNDYKENGDLTLQQRTSVSAINTSGKISDKELVRQQKLAELMLSDSDDDDLILCDQPVANRITEEISHDFNKTMSSPRKQDNINDTSSTSVSANKVDSPKFNCDKSTCSSDYSNSENKTKNLNFSDNSNRNETKLTGLNSNVVDITSSSRSVVSDVATKVRNIWANKQFGSSLKPLDPKTNSINLIPNKIQGKSSMDNTENKSYKQISNKRLSGDDDMKSSRKKMKTESENESKIDHMFTKIHRNQSENCDPGLASCPVCNKSIPSSQINQHLDLCLGVN